MTHYNLEDVQKRVEEHSQFIPSLKEELARVIVGQHKLTDCLIMALICKGHVLVEGVPGLAKTLTIASLSETLQADNKRIQFTPDLLPADVMGTTIYNPQEHTFSVKKGPIFTNLLLADEINRAPAKVQSSLLEAMQERQITLGGETHALPKPFLVMATQNPIEQEGTYPLPEAQMDRFMFKVRVDYLTREQEALVIERMAHTGSIPHVKPVIDLKSFDAARDVVDEIYIDQCLKDYILDLIYATRPGYEKEISEFNREAAKSVHPFIETGVSPRAGLSLSLAARANAFMKGRAHVVPQDIKDCAYEVLRHRIAISYEAEAEGLDSDHIIERLLAEIRIS